VQVISTKPVLKAPGYFLFKLGCDEPLSNFAFKFNLRRYTKPSILLHYADVESIDFERHSGPHSTASQRTFDIVIEMKVGPVGLCSPGHHPNFRHSFLELN